MLTLAAKLPVVSPGDVEQVLTARRIGIEPADDIVAEPGGEHEGVIAGATVHDVVASTTDQDVGAGAAVERVDAAGRSAYRHRRRR